MIKSVSLVLLGTALVASPALASERAVTLAGLSVTVWSDDAGQQSPKPVIIFSHGFHGCATQSRFLMEALASAGYLVFAPNHADAACGGGASTSAGRPELSFRDATKWDETTYRDRGDDIRRLLDALRSDDRFKSRCDWKKVGLAGHSLGGYTVLGLGGAWPSWRLPDVRAVLALSPYAGPFVDRHTLGQVAVPVMYQGGTRDLGVTPTLHKSMGAYDQTGSSKYYVEFEGAGHFAWTNFPSPVRGDIVSYSLAFLNHYVKGEAATSALTRATSSVAVFRYSSDVGTNQHRGEP